MSLNLPAKLLLKVFLGGNIIKRYTVYLIIDWEEDDGVSYHIGDCKKMEYITKKSLFTMRRGEN